MNVNLLTKKITKYKICQILIFLMRIRAIVSQARYSTEALHTFILNTLPFHEYDSFSFFMPLHILFPPPWRTPHGPLNTRYKSSPLQGVKPSLNSPFLSPRNEVLSPSLLHLTTLPNIGNCTATTRLVQK